MKPLIMSCLWLFVCLCYDLPVKNFVKWYIRMKGVNKAVLIGRVGGDPVIRYTPAGAGVANFSLATNETWTDKQTGEKQERTEWHRVVAYGALAGIVEQWIRRGALLYIEGKIKTDKWKDRDGIERYTTQIVANNLLMLGGKQESSAGVDPEGQPGTEQPSGGASDVPF